MRGQLHHRDMAERCRRLANATMDDLTGRLLRQLADEYDERAAAESPVNDDRNAPRAGGRAKS